MRLLDAATRSFALLATLTRRFPEPLPRDPRDLRNFERKESSQNGEDGIIAELLSRLDIGAGVFVEIGVEDGMECNCRALVKQGWSGWFIEGDPQMFRRLSKNYEGSVSTGCIEAMVSSSNIETLLERHGVPKDLALLSIDIDGNDYWVWKAIEGWKPAVVVIEYNAAHVPPEQWVMKENDAHVWGKNTYHGASLAALGALGRRKGYRLVGTDSRGVNSFFVRDDLFDPTTFVDAETSYHYSRPRYGRFGHGHPSGKGIGVTGVV